MMPRSQFARPASPAEKLSIVTVVDSDRARRVPVVSSAALPAAPAAGAGDALEPNNFIEPDLANSFVSPCRVQLGAAGLTGQPKLESVLPDRVSLTAVITRDCKVVWDLTVLVTNSLEATAAVVVSVPRLDGVLLLEEKHYVGPVVYEPTVTEKEKADRLFAQAAASSEHSATLSDTQEDACAIKLDKVAAGAIAHFTIKFIQPSGLRGCAAVAVDADEADLRIADIAVAPGFTSLNGLGVPFKFTLLHDKAFDVVMPSDSVLAHDASQFCSDVTSVLQLAPSCVTHASGSWKSLQWESDLGLATGTVLKVRLAERKAKGPNLGSMMQSLHLEESATPQSAVSTVDTCPRVCFSMSDGAPQSVSLAKLTVPSTIHGMEPNPASHVLTILVDTSGSTGARNACRCRRCHPRGLACI